MVAHLPGTEECRPLGTVPQLPAGLRPVGPALQRRLHGNYVGTRLASSSRGFDNYLPEEEILYFVNPSSTGSKSIPSPRSWGSRGTLSGIAIEVDGHEDRHWDDVLQVLNGSTVPAVRFLRRRETHQCRLVSYNRTRLPYLWGVRMLRYIDGTGWAFLEPGA